MTKEEVKNKAKKMLKNIIPDSPKAVWTKMAIFLCLLANAPEAKAEVYNSEHINEYSELSASTNASDSLSDDDIDFYLRNEKIKRKAADYIADQKMQELQDEIIARISQLQSDITTAKKQGRKKSFIANLFKRVSPVSLSGDNNYCTAGAMSAYCEVSDASIKQIIEDIVASKESSPKDFHLFSHPNISCPAFCVYYKEALGENFIDTKSPKFKSELKNLEKGDVLILRSSQNTSSSLHCVVFEGYGANNEINIKSLNTEKDYSVSTSKIRYIAKFPRQFRQNLIAKLYQNRQFLLDMIKENQQISSEILMQRSYKLKHLKSFQSVFVPTPPIKIL